MSHLYHHGLKTLRYGTVKSSIYDSTHQENHLNLNLIHPQHGSSYTHHREQSHRSLAFNYINGVCPFEGLESFYIGGIPSIQFKANILNTIYKSKKLGYSHSRTVWSCKTDVVYFLMSSNAFSVWINQWPKLCDKTTSTRHHTCRHCHEHELQCSCCTLCCKASQCSLIVTDLYAPCLMLLCTKYLSIIVCSVSCSKTQKISLDPIVVLHR